MALILSNVKIWKRNCCNCALNNSKQVLWGNDYYGEYITADVENPHDGLVDNIHLKFWDGYREYDGALFYEIPPKTKINVGGYITCHSRGLGVFLWASDINNYIPSNQIGFNLINFFDNDETNFASMSRYLRSIHDTIQDVTSVSVADAFRQFKVQVTNMSCEYDSFALQFTSLDNGTVFASSVISEIAPLKCSYLTLDICPQIWVDTIKNNPDPLGRILGLNIVSSKRGIIKTYRLEANFAPPAISELSDIPEGCVQINPTSIPGAELLPIPNMCKKPWCVLSQLGCSPCGAFCECIATS